MKRFFQILFCGALIIMCASVFATNRTKKAGSTNQGEYTKIGGSTADTIVLNDTVSYVYQVNHFNSVYPELDCYWTKVGSGNPTVKLDVLQSKDGVTYTTVKKGKAQAAYTKTFSPTASGVLTVSFELDTAHFTDRYIKYQWSTGNTASTKAKITNYLKINIR